MLILDFKVVLTCPIALHNIPNILITVVAVSVIG